MDYDFNKETDIEKIAAEIQENATIGGYNIGCSGSGESMLTVHMNQELSSSEESVLIDIVNNHISTPSQEQQVRQAVVNAITFGRSIIVDFTTENVLLGITQAGLTSHVRSVTSEIITALNTGSLYDAIDLVKVLDPADLDENILTEERLLTFRNRIEEYLGVPKASVWNE